MPKKAFPLEVDVGLLCLAVIVVLMFVLITSFLLKERGVDVWSLLVGLNFRRKNRDSKVAPDNTEPDADDTRPGSDSPSDGSSAWSGDSSPPSPPSVARIPRPPKRPSGLIPMKAP